MKILIYLILLTGLISCGGGGGGNGNGKGKGPIADNEEIEEVEAVAESESESEENSDDNPSEIAHTVTKIDIKKTSLTITGTNLSNVTSVKLKQNSTYNLTITSKTDNIIQTAYSSTVRLFARITSQLIVSSAHASTTSTLNLSDEITSCPDSTWALATAGGYKRYKFCIEKEDRTATSNPPSALFACYSVGADLCYRNELALACTSATSLSLNDIAGQQWTRGIEPQRGLGDSALESGYSSSFNSTAYSLSGSSCTSAIQSCTIGAGCPSLPYRCCIR